MAFYEDLTPYNYNHYSEKELNIGWLQKDQPFSVGEVPSGFLNKLKIFAQNDFLIHDMMGYHECEFCEEIGADSSNEIRVVGVDGMVYAAPFLVIHYIEKHNYLPPKEFIDAVLNGPVPGSAEYSNVICRLPESWERRKPDPNDKDYEKKMREVMVRSLAESVDREIMDKVLSQSEDFKKFIEAYNGVMPAVYKVSLKK